MRSLFAEGLGLILEAGRRIFTSPTSLEIVRQDDIALVLEGGGGLFTVNKRFGHVKSGDRIVARFDAIESIDVKHHHADEDEPETWSVRLHIKGWFSSVTIGRTPDDAQASIVAARLSTLTGKRVRAL